MRQTAITVAISVVTTLLVIWVLWTVMYQFDLQIPVL
jgi:preprotein translocase subunit SecD